MTYKIKDEKGEVINTIIADEAFVEEHHPGRWELVPEAVTVEVPVIEPELPAVKSDIMKRLDAIEAKLDKLLVVKDEVVTL